MRVTNVFAEAIIKLQVGDQLWFDAAEGHGPVNALDAALRKALERTYPSLADMRLVDYKVRVVDSGAGTAASTRVNIESTDKHETWGTIGVSENVIEASWQALVDAVEYKLHKDETSNLTSVEHLSDLLTEFLLPSPPALRGEGLGMRGRIDRRQRTFIFATHGIAPHPQPLSPEDWARGAKK